MVTLIKMALLMVAEPQRSDDAFIEYEFVKPGRYFNVVKSDSYGGVRFGASYALQVSASGVLENLIYLDGFESVP